MAKYHDSENRDDLHYAIEYNGDALAGKFAESDIDEIVAEVCGEHDGYDWWWVISLKNGGFALLHGGCDYTGWDCQSSLHVDYLTNIQDGALSAAERAPEREYGDTGRTIRKNLVAQVAGTQPFAMYTE